MKTYIVHIPEVHMVAVEVEDASSIEKAKEIAEDLYAEGDGEDSIYHHTVTDKSKWEVKDPDENEKTWRMNNHA